MLLQGCAGPKAYVRPGFLDHPPRRVAVLPFVITYPYDLKTAEQPIPPAHAARREMFRNIFYQTFVPYGYEDVPLAQVDERLSATWGPLDTGAWRLASPQELGKALGADALIYGEISRLSHFVTPLYTDTRLDASLRMVDAASADVVWRHQVIVADRGGALFQKSQAIDFLMDQVRSFQPTVKFRRVAEVAARRVLEGMPNPPMTLASQPAPHLERGKVRLALLPLGAKRANWQPQAERARMDLAVSLQESPFEIVELQQVDAALTSQGWSKGQPLPRDLSLDALAKALGADVVLRGAMTDWGRSYFVLESWVKAELELELLDTRSGERLWSKKRKNTRQAGLFKGPTGLNAIVTAPITGLSRSRLDQVASRLAQLLVKDLNGSSAVQAYLRERAARQPSAAAMPE